MAQQTAVEWLWNTLIDTYNLAGISPGQEHLPDGILSYLEQAKQMEKEQIQEAWNDGNFLGRNGNILADYSDGKGYYKSEFENK